MIRRISIILLLLAIASPLFAGHDSPTISAGVLTSVDIDTSAELATIITDETGTAGLVVFSGSPTFTGELSFSSGAAITAGSYQVGRDADATNQLHFNVPTGATFEWSVNDAVEATLSATAVNFQNNTITTTGGGSLTGTWSNMGTVTTIDINGGTLDGVVIGGASAAAATVTTLSQSGLTTWSAGAAITAGSYQIGRDADGTNQLHFNVPTGATFEMSVNDVAEYTFSATAANFQSNTITTTGGGSLTGTWSDLGSVTTIDINGGTVDGAVIGGSSAAAGTFTTISQNNLHSWSAGAAITAGSYQVGRDADGTNQLHFNVPTAATFEWSVNDAAEMTLSATALNLQNNSITTTGGGSLTGTWTDLGSVTTVDINGGTVDGAVIGGASAAAGTFTTISQNNQHTWSAGAAVTAGSYQVGRDADATNQLHFNVPTGTGFEFSVNDAAELVLNATTANFQNNDVTTTGNGSFANVTSTGLLTVSVTAAITASTTQTQGNGALTKTLNEVATVANNNDTVTLPTAAAGVVVYIANNGANTLQIFPASGDAIDGASVNTSKTLAAGTNMEYIAHDATNWNSFRGAL